MKKIFIAIALFLAVPAVGISAPSTLTGESVVESDSEVVFRSNQRLRSRDGRSIYLYTSGRCELFDGDRLWCECTYTVQSGEVRLLDENGRTIYKGSYSTDSYGNLRNLTIAGTTYYAFQKQVEQF